MEYKPIYEINNEILNLVSDIMENLGKITMVNDLEKLPNLRKVSRIKSIYSSLAIEQNSLNFEEVTSVINNQKVLGKESDIKAVLNAYDAYNLIDSLNPYSLSDLLKAHKVMMDGLVSEAGSIRTKNVGVIDSDGNVIHLAPQPEFVTEEMNNLFYWLKNSNDNILIKSCIFHYEFEFIHPFNDGNGRMGRLWQTLILSKWKKIFTWLPIESIIKSNQQEYYNAIEESNDLVSANPFIIFMLKCINNAIIDMIKDSKLHFSHQSERINDLLNVIEYYPMSLTELMQKLNKKSISSFRDNYIKPALNLGLILMTNPDKPNSKNQKYYRA